MSFSKPKVVYNKTEQNIYNTIATFTTTNTNIVDKALYLRDATMREKRYLCWKV